VNVVRKPGRSPCSNFGFTSIGGPPESSTAKAPRRIGTAALFPNNRYLLQPSAPTEERKEEENQEYHKQDLGDGRGGAGDDAESEDARQNRHDKEYNRVV
jgi:hypothetical protein